MNLSDLIQRIKWKTVGLEMPIFGQNTHYFLNRIGLEIGGPSIIFRPNHILPVYPLATQVDGVNFATQTVWEKVIEPGLTYKYDSAKLGHQYILEASDLAGIVDGQYDFLLSSHSLEHCANALKTVLEWKRVVGTGGALLLILPHKDYTFDHNREVTTFDHLLADLESGVDESDLTHVDEIVAQHDIAQDNGLTDINHLKKRSTKNFDNRCLHHHVFDEELLRQVFDYAGIETIFATFHKPYHTIILGQK